MRAAPPGPPTAPRRLPEVPGAPHGKRPRDDGAGHAPAERGVGPGDPDRRRRVAGSTARPRKAASTRSRSAIQIRVGTRALRAEPSETGEEPPVGPAEVPPDSVSPAPRRFVYRSLYGIGMGRPPGSRNADHDRTREALADRLANRLLAPGGPEASLREYADAAEVSVPTLRHYFQDREGVIRAALHALRLRGDAWLAWTRDPGEGDARASLTGFLRLLILGWRDFGVGAIQASGLAAGLGGAGSVYLEEILEPVQQALEARIAALAARGDLPPRDPRAAALALLAPVFVALLHQVQLDGRRCRPLDLDPFVDELVDGWLHGWGNLQKIHG